MSTSPSHREGHDTYNGVVVVLNDHWRVIVCKDGVQWIVQFAKKRRGGVEWTSRSYLRDRDALIRLIHELSGEISPPALATLAALSRRI